MRARLSTAALLLLLLGLATDVQAEPRLLYAPEGNRLRRYDLDTLNRDVLVEDVLIRNASEDPGAGRDINGMVCAIPDGSGRFIAGEDSWQPHPLAGWGVLTADGTQVGKLTPTTLEPMAEPYGCAFDAEGRLFTTEVGRKFFGGANGQLILWFPPFEGFPGPPGAYPDTDATRDNYCKLATDLGTPGGVAIDRQGRVYVAASSGMEVVRFSPPFPTGPDAAGGCGARDALGSPMADAVQRERFLGPLFSRGMITYSGLAVTPSGNVYAASVATGRIAEFAPDGSFVRMILEPSSWLPPHTFGTPEGLALDSDGTLYYADLDLHLGWNGIDTGSDGKIWRIRFDADGNPLPPETIARGLAFPDGLGILPGDLEAAAAAGSLRPYIAVALGGAEHPPPGESAGRAVTVAIVLVLLFTAGWMSARRARS